MQRGYKILYLTTIDATAYRFLIPQVKSLQGDGHDVQIACHQGHFVEHFQAAQIPFHHIPFSRKITSPNNVRAFTLLLDLVREEKYDLLHVHTPVAAFLGRLAARLAGGTKTLYTAHGLHIVEGGNQVQNIAFLILEKLAGHWTDALIVMNSEDYETARNHRLVANDTVYYVKGVGVDTDVYSPGLLDAIQTQTLKQQLGCESDQVVGMIAELMPRKGHADLIQAAAQVLCQFGDVSFLLIGDGPLMPKLRAMAQNLPVEDKVRFLGWRFDIPQLLEIMDILVLTSRREGLPRSIQEGMAMGKPVVATDVKGNRDLVIPGETGFLVPQQNPTALAQALLKLLHDPSLAARMGSKARSVAVSELSLGKIVQQTTDIVNDLLWAEAPRVTS